MQATGSRELTFSCFLEGAVHMDRSITSLSWETLSHQLLHCQDNVLSTDSQEQIPQQWEGTVHTAVSPPPMHTAQQMTGAALAKIETRCGWILVIGGKEVPT